MHQSLHDDVIMRIEERLSRLTGYPPSNGDAFELRRYRHLGAYDFHLDTPVGEMFLSPNRTLSVVMYCHDAAEYESAVRKNATSGSIAFPLADLPRAEANEMLADMVPQGYDPQPAGAPILLGYGIGDICTPGANFVVLRGSREGARSVRGRS